MTLALVLGGLAAVVTLVNLVSLGMAGRRLRRRGRLPRPPADAEGVTIVRPVRGIEPFIEETLRAGFTLEYPTYELVHCVEDSDDAVIPLVRRLMAEYPDVPARLLIGRDRVSDNPKLNNCVKGWDAARHPWVVLADSNVAMPPDYVSQLRAAWRADTGLVCSTPLGARPDGFAAVVECAFLNTMQARWQYVGESVGLGFAQGKSMLWRREFLEAQGGIRRLGLEIAEDAAATKLVRAAGRHVHLVDAPFEQPLGRRTPAEVWQRQIRWGRLRRKTFPLFFAPEVLSGALVPAVLAGWACAMAGHSAAWGVLAVMGPWYAAEVALAAAKGWYLTPWLVPACLVRDCVIPVMWAAAWLGGEFVWRGNAMSVSAKAGAGLVEQPLGR